MKKACSLLRVILLTLFVYTCYAQAPVVPVPRISIPTTAYPHTSPSNRSTYPQLPTNTFNVKAQREALLQEVQAHLHQQQEVAKGLDQSNRANELQRQFDIQMLTEYGFPSQAEYDGTSAFYSAFEEINNMLKGSTSLNLGRTVFLIENAWHNNKYDYNEYRNAIKQSVDFCNQKIEEEKLDRNDNLVKNMMLFRYIVDTLEINNSNSQKALKHLPIKYNYEDYDSKIGYDSHYVTTLMQTGAGQCHSMPLYYLVLAEEIGADAYWSFSPRHSFIKIQDKRGKWHNLELTAKAILSDTHYMNSSYIKAEALQNKIYLEPMDKINVVAEMLLELARGYYQKYGLDDFYLKCIDTAQQHLNNDLNAKMLRSIYQTRLTLTLGKLLNAPNPTVMKELYPEAYQHFELMQTQYKEIDDMGYEELPTSIYALWLNHIANEKKKADQAKLPSTIKILKKEEISISK